MTPGPGIRNGPLQISSIFGPVIPVTRCQIDVVTCIVQLPFRVVLEFLFRFSLYIVLSRLTLSFSPASSLLKKMRYYYYICFVFLEIDMHKITAAAVWDIFCIECTRKKAILTAIKYLYVNLNLHTISICDVRIRDRVWGLSSSDWSDDVRSMPESGSFSKF